MEYNSNRQGDPAISPRVGDEKRGPGSSKSWASGRVLTQAQRERKRAVDRQAQRARRKWTHVRMAGMEAQLGALMSALTNKGHTEERPEMDCFNPETQETANVHTRLSNTPESYITGGSEDHWALSPPESLVSVLQTHGEQNRPGEYVPAVHSRNDRVDTNQAPLAMSRTYHSGPRDLDTQPNCASHITVSKVLGLTSNARRSLDTTSLCNLELEKLSRIAKDQISLDEQANQNILIQAILQGWETVIILCPLWAILRQIDSLIFERSSNITRFAMLTTVHRMLIVSNRPESFINIRF